jgi:hypothetical protein
MLGDGDIAADLAAFQAPRYFAAPVGRMLADGGRLL